MVLYRCPKCGREVEMPEGNYVCKLCLTPLEVKVSYVDWETHYGIKRMWNDVELFWLEESKLFGKPIYNVKEGYWTKPAARFTDREKAEKYRDRENAYIYLRSRLGDRKYLIGIAERVGLTEDELEGFSNASVMGEIRGSDDFTNIAKELAENIPSSNPAVTQPTFAIPPTYRTPKQRFEFLVRDHILNAVTSSRQAIARLEILRERAEGEDVEKINTIISNIKEIDKELIELKSSIERRGEQPTFEPRGFRDTAELDRRTNTKDLITFTWVPLRNSRMFLARSKGHLRNIHARLLETGQTEEAKNVEREIETLTETGKELYEKQRQIRELKVGEP